jgi:hypothetical protein
MSIFRYEYRSLYLYVELKLWLSVKMFLFPMAQIVSEDNQRFLKKQHKAHPTLTNLFVSQKII